jgi:CspA family cold shock protein
MPVGLVKFFNGKHGVGSIAQAGGGPDVFVHITALERAGLGGLVAGQRVAFDILSDKDSGSSAATNLRTS